MKNLMLIMIVAASLAGTSLAATALWDPNVALGDFDMLNADNWSRDLASATAHGLCGGFESTAILDGDWTYNKSMHIGTTGLGVVKMVGGLLDVSSLRIGDDYWTQKDGEDNVLHYGDNGILIVENGTVDASNTTVGHGNLGILTINGGTVNAGSFVTVGTESGDLMGISTDGTTIAYYVPFAGTGYLNMTGGVLNCEHINVGRDPRCLAEVDLSGDALLEVYDDNAAEPSDSYFRIGDPEAITRLTIAGAARLRAGSISLLTPTIIKFVLDESSLSDSRIDVYDYDPEDTFIITYEDVTIGGEIYLEFAGDPIANIPFDIISSVTDLNQIESGSEPVVDKLSAESAAAGWSLAIVLDGNGGSILQATYSPDFATCEEVIATGFGLEADFDKDCDVDLNDFAVMSAGWLGNNNPEDINHTPNW